MSVALRLLGCLPGLALLGINQAACSTIFPTGVVYSNWTDESEEAKVCEIVLDVSNPPSREVVKFITLAGYNKFDGTVLAGILMAAADTTTPNKYQIARISDAAFSSRTFNSLGHWITKSMTTVQSWRRHKILFSPRLSLTQCFPELMNCVLLARTRR